MAGTSPSAPPKAADNAWETADSVVKASDEKQPETSDIGEPVRNNLTPADSKEKERVTVPGLSGLTVGEAKKILEKKKLR